MINVTEERFIASESLASNNNLGQILSLDCDEAKVLCRGAVTRINITGYDLTRHILRLEDDKYRVVLDFKESKV